MEILISLTQEMAVFVVIAYIYCKSPLFKSLTADSVRGRDRKNMFDRIAAVYRLLPVFDLSTPDSAVRQVSHCL
ncbi:MAG: hypothetical protein ACYC6Q_08755 [Syntrophales bacterium]